MISDKYDGALKRPNSVYISYDSRLEELLGKREQNLLVVPIPGTPYVSAFIWVRYDFLKQTPK